MAALLLGASHAYAQASTTASPPALTSQLLSLALGLALVLAVIGGAAWLLKRLSPRGYGVSGPLRVVGGVAVGQRERVVIVEVGTTWLVLGVAPGHVTALHQLPRAAEVESGATRTDAQPPFAHWLKTIIEKRGVPPPQSK